MMNLIKMRVDDFHFNLPDTQIAQFPCAQRTASKLMQIGDPNLHLQFQQLINLLEPGDLLIFNDTKVLRARLLGHKKSGGKAELLIERILSDRQALAQIRVSKPPKMSDQILLSGQREITVLEKNGPFYLIEYAGPETCLEMIEAIGEIPLPPYMRRKPTEDDQKRYQTVYAKHQGSVAAPTAGLHFDEDLISQIAARGVHLGYLTLHIGAGTFTPVRTENLSEHKMHTETFTISAELCTQIQQAKAAHKRVIAVGTTTLRALESACQDDSQIKPMTKDTNIFIYPGFQFQCVDALITNFHLPKSTLLMLVCAFGGYARLMQAYNQAVAADYRFYSYGDAMFIPRAEIAI